VQFSVARYPLIFTIASALPGDQKFAPFACHSAARVGSSGASASRQARQRSDPTNESRCSTGSPQAKQRNGRSGWSPSGVSEPVVQLAMFSIYSQSSALSLDLSRVSSRPSVYQRWPRACIFWRRQPIRSMRFSGESVRLPAPARSSRAVGADVVLTFCDDTDFVAFPPNRDTRSSFSKGLKRRPHIRKHSFIQ
jgi:hypothetical protein